MESSQTVAGGNIVYAGKDFADYAPEPLPPVSPEWSPVVTYEAALDAR